MSKQLVRKRVKKIMIWTVVLLNHSKQISKTLLLGRKLKMFD